jgi:FAD synthetase
MRKVVLVGGCFDLLHYGHIKFLKEAKKLGDFLIVALESDENTKKLKGKGRPIHTQSQRAEILEALKFVDKVLYLPEMKSDSDYWKVIKAVSPSVIAVTEGDPNINKKKLHAKKVGAKIVQIPPVKGISSSKIIRLLSKEP